jgi:nucleoid DNA-binding protein
MLMKDHGVSKRKAEKSVNAVFDAMKRALTYGDFVDSPIGTIWVDSRRPGRPKRSVQTFSNIQTKKEFRKLVDRPDREIHFRPSPDLIEPPQKPKRQTGKSQPGKSRSGKTRKPGKRKSPPAPPRAPSKPLTGWAADFKALYIHLVSAADLCDEEFDSLLALCGDNPQRLLDHLRWLVAQNRRFENNRQLIASIGRREAIAPSRGR